MVDAEVLMLWAGKIGAGLITAWKGIPAVWSGMKKLRASVSGVIDLVEETKKSNAMTADIVDNVRRIKYQLFPNGGASLFDTVTELRNMIKASVQLSDQPSYTCGSDGTVIDINKSMLDIVGLDRDSAMGYGLFHQLLPEDAQNIEKRWFEFVHSEGGLFDEVYTWVNKRNGAVTKGRSVAIQQMGKDGTKVFRGVFNPII